MKLAIHALWAVVSAIVSVCPALPAEPLPWRSIGENDIRVLEDSRVDAALRLALIRRATRSIDIVTYAQDADSDVAMPLMTALREAADRGVTVRFVTNALFSAVTDPLRRVPRYLCESPTVAPIELLLIGNDDPSNPWGLGEFAHEKFIIIDGQWVFHSGRMLAGTSLGWLDKSYLIRGALVADSSAVFDRLWEFARRPFPPQVSPPLAPGRAPEPYRHYSPPPALAALGARQSAALAQALAWLDSPSGPPAATARLLHFDFLQQMWLHRFPKSTDERLALLDDPIARRLIERISQPGTKEVLIGTMVALFRPELKRALLAAVANGTRVHLFVNDAGAAATESPLALNWILSLPEVAELLAAGIDVETFSASREDGYDWIFLHEKLAVIDDTVIFGSHNFNVPSSTNNDEASYEVRSPAFAAKMRHLFYLDLTFAGTPLALSDVRAQLRSEGTVTRAKRWLGRQLEWMF